MRKAALLAAAFASALILLTSNSPKAHAAAASSAHSTVQKTSNKHTKIVKVKPGDYLAKIAKAHKTTSLRLFYANKIIKNPDLIYPSQKLRIPAASEKLKPRAIPGNTQIAAQPKSAAAPTHSVAKSTAPTASSGNVWDQLAICESGGNWSINTGNGFYGGLQFTLSSWRAVGGAGYPHQASRSEQIARAEKLQTIQGWGAWPACSAKLDL